MSGNDNEELIDYEDEHDVTISATNGATTSAGGLEEKDKKKLLWHSFYRLQRFSSQTRIVACHQ